MLRLALYIFGGVIVLLFGLTLLPERRRSVPDSSITLAQTELTLYPQEDPEAEWFFSTPEAQYNPDTSETLMRSIENGERRVGEDRKLDFTIESEEIIITGDDNLRGDKILATLVNDEADTSDDTLLDMNTKFDSQVLINQREGKFEIPSLDVSGDELSGHYERVITDFALEDFSSGGEGTVGFSEFQLEDRDGE